MNVESIYSIFKTSTGITTDSRDCPDGSMFFALKGESFDGNVYALKALQSGSAYAVVDDASVVVDERFILVSDVLLALQALANHHRKVLATPVIGITGSNGKTTTKELLAVVLSRKYNLHFTQGNFNNHIGVPLTLLKLNSNHDMVIIEMGANHPGEIAELCAIAEPNMGIITNIGKAHLEGFGGIEGVIKTKRELYEFIKSVEGQLFVNGGDDLLLSLAKGIEQVLYNSSTSSFKVSVADAVPTLSLTVQSGQDEVLLQTQMVGEYNCINVEAVLQIGATLGVSLSTMIEALESYVPTNNRSQILETGKNRIVLDAYNANPASMGVAVANFVKLKASSKAVILGAMKELGEYSLEEHGVLLALVQQANFDIKICVGKEFLDVEMPSSDVLIFETLASVEKYLSGNPLIDSTVLIKGSRSMKMETLVEIL